MMTDPIADMLTRIRNALRIERTYVDMPASKVKVGLAEALQREGYVWDHEIIEQKPQDVLRVNLKYGPNGERVIQTIDRVSKPGCRVYSNVRSMPEVQQGMGVVILSTPQGILSNREARKQGVGGEVLCRIW
jgi:small subunit ribosomal protein S8